MTPPRNAAGLLPFRRADGLEVFLGHLGGPLWARKDAGAWTLVKGELETGPDGEPEDAFAAARREWVEETGLTVPGGEWLDLGEIRQRSGKRVRAWAVPADAAAGAPGVVDLSGATSGTFTLAWPPRSGRLQEFPELDRFAWWTVEVARELMVSGQSALLDRLVEQLG